VTHSTFLRLGCAQIVGHDDQMAMNPGPLPDVIPPGDLLRDTEVVTVSGIAGRYSLVLPQAWRVFYAFGGATLATAIRAAVAELARDDLQLISADATYCQAVPCGPLACAVEVLRSGRRGAQVQVRLWATDEPRSDPRADLLVTVVFGSRDAASPYHLVGAGFPSDVPGPEDCAVPARPDVETPFDNIPYHHQTEWRHGLGHAPWEPDVAGGNDPRTVTWFRFLQPPLLDDGSWCDAALAVPGDMLAPAIVEGVGRARGYFLVVTMQLSIQFFAPMRGTWLCQDTRALHVSGGFATGSVNLWSEDRTLVASATQTAMLTPIQPG